MTEDRERRGNRYPSRTRRERAVRDLKEGDAAWIAGRVLSSRDGGFKLKDSSGVVKLDCGEGEGPEVRRAKDSFSSGDIVELHGKLSPNGRFRVGRSRVLCPGRAEPIPGSPNEALWNLPADLIERRQRMREALRRFFHKRGFLEVESPCLVGAPGQEPHLDPFQTRLDGLTGGRELYLITSPEYFHKRLLAAGYEKIFEMARVFRNGPSETRGLHHFEFIMVEWYRAFASYLEIMEDVEALIHSLAKEAGLGQDERFKPPFERLSMEDAFARHAGVDLEPYLSRDPAFALEAVRNGDYGILPGDGPDPRFFKIFLSAVEPGLGRPRPVFLLDYPACQASLSKLREDRPELCERFELYIDGVELANGFTELNDPQEQADRFEAEARLRAERGGRPVPEDPVFLEALHSGMPPSGGVALGFDRLFMVLWGGKDLKGIIPFMRG